ncbi:hypothetical protein GPROT1_01491 [Gammaproteobacteria bacterium]|nr:hypothetical protein GPROT1_01491 [Gammaproteobacteria bacterium]
MLLNIEHRTHVAYDAPVDYTIQQLHLTPQDGFGQRVKRWEIRVNGKMQAHADAYGNLSHMLVVDGPHRAIDITASGEVETGLDIPPAADTLPLQVYLRATPLTTVDAALTEFSRHFGQSVAGMDKRELYALMRAVRDRMIPLESGTEASGTAAEAFASGLGTSHDHAHVFIACCRALGVPARFVSGYLFSAARQMVANHAWADAWVEGEWMSFDIANGQRANGVHVRLATGLDARDASPVGLVRRDVGTSTSFRVHTAGMEQSQQ